MKVAKYRHPDCDQWLVLPAPDREGAADMMGCDLELLSEEMVEMTEEEFHDLPEFEG